MSQTRIENRLCNGLFSPSEWNAAWLLCALSYIRRQKEKGRSANVREKIADTTEKKTATGRRNHPEKFAPQQDLCNFAVVFQNCINKYGDKIYTQGIIRRDRRGVPLLFGHNRYRAPTVRQDDADP